MSIGDHLVGWEYRILKIKIVIALVNSTEHWPICR